MLPATRTWPITSPAKPGNVESCRLQLVSDGLNVGERGQSGFVAETLNFVGRCCARKPEMIVPAQRGIAEIRINVGAVKHIASAVGVDHPLGGDSERWKRVYCAGFVIPKQASLSHRDAAYPATPAFEIIQHRGRFHIHLLAEALRDDGDVDEFKQLVGVAAQTTA